MTASIDIVIAKRGESIDKLLRGLSMSQLTQGKQVRLMYLENKEGDIDGHPARIGWVCFSKSGRSVHYRGRTLTRIKGGGVSGNFFCHDTGEEYWVSGVKVRGSNAHWADPARIYIDEDAQEAYDELRSGRSRNKSVHATSA